MIEAKFAVGDFVRVTPSQSNLRMIPPDPNAKGNQPIAWESDAPWDWIDTDKAFIGRVGEVNLPCNGNESMGVKYALEWHPDGEARLPVAWWPEKQLELVQKSKPVKWPKGEW